MKAEREIIRDGYPKHEELIDFVNAFPALLWRIDLVNNTIEYLNSYRIEPLGANSGLLLQNVDFRRRHVAAEDIYLLDDFMLSVRNGETAATVFRLKHEDDSVQWIKVTGVVDPKNPRYYLGYMLDVTKTAGIVQSITETDAEMEATIELLDNPALLVDPRTRVLMAHNAASREAFLYRPDEFSRLKFSDLCHKSVESHINRIYEELVFEKVWKGRLLFQRKNRSIFAGDVIMRLFLFKGRRVLRVSIHNLTVEDDMLKTTLLYQPRPPSAPPAYREHAQGLLKKVEKVKDINRVLHILLEDQFGEECFDAIMYSDIYSKRNKVMVYTAGKAFERLPQGEMFSYEGTIAENIDRFKLEHLIVEDTFSSIKAIDWALFVPHGIRSYFAKPFYERKTMRSVLILCSLKRKHFSTRRLDDYAIYYEPFLLGLRNWRKHQKAVKTYQNR